MPAITRNAVRCKKCNEVIESTHRHDFKWCKCGSVAVDGGDEYKRRAFQHGALWEELGPDDEVLSEGNAPDANHCGDDYSCGSDCDYDCGEDGYGGCDGD